jgi:signal transduction histidine kinase
MESSPLLVALTIAFATVLAVLVTLVWLQVQRSYDVVLPAGRDLIAAGSSSAVPEPGPEVLILNSYHRGYSWSDHEMDGIIETFQRSGSKIRPVIEYLDCKQFPDMTHFDRLRDLMLVKYRGRKFPVVIVADNPALQFALTYRPRLFPEAVIVFCGINGYSPKLIEGYRNVTGVAELLDADGTMSMAMKLHPRTRKVFVVNDYTITGLATRRQAEEQLKPFEGLVEFQYMENMTTPELIEQVKTLPPDSLVLALSYSLDKDGHVVNHERIAKLLSANAPVPVYGCHEERIGYGIMGGYLIGGERHGARAAELAVRLLSGVPVSRVPIEVSSRSILMFDYNQLKRFYVPLSRLPKDAQIVNLPVSFISRYRGLVLTTLCLIVVLAAGIMILGLNVYHRRLAEKEQKKLQAQLMQAQKMEAVGLLAGGIAHDFNNILTAIVGYATLVKRKTQAGDPNLPFLEQILSAADRAAKLTRGLLAFSRKQVIDTRPVDLNMIVRNTEKIVKPLIGADIVFSTVLASHRMTVMADSGQVEQVLMNLCTNARDAMSAGGRLTIETGELVVDELYRKTHLLEKAGRYAVVSVSDTGAGMDEETRKQIFEPFFTTKEVGKGTGLGLSIAYGIVKQHKGIITVYSEPGKGTTFKLFLPRILTADDAVPRKQIGQVRGGRETLLLAEDEPSVRSSISIMLNEAGYTVIEAVDGTEAVELFMEHKETIHLLLTDVIMPGKNGGQVYEQIRLINPLIKVLFMSGYTGDMLQNKGVEAEKMNFISKPVLHDELLKKVRQALDS